MARQGSSFKWLVLTVFVLANAILNFSNMAFVSRSVEAMAQFDMTQAQLTALSTLGVVPGALFSIAMGNFFDKHGAKSIRVVGFALLAAAALCQVIRIFAFSYVQLVIITLVAGTLFLPAQVLPAKMIEAWFNRDEISTAMGIYGAAAGLGITVAFALGTVFPSLTSVLAFCAGGYVLLAVLWALCTKMPQEGGDRASAPAEPRDAVANVSVKAVLKSKSMWLVMLCSGCASGGPFLLNTYMVTAFLANGLPETYAGILGAVFNASLAIGAVLGGYIVAKFGRINPPYLVVCLVGGISIFVAYLAPAGVLTFVLMIIGGLFSSSSLSLNLARVSLLPLTGEFGSENIGIAGGLNNTAIGVCVFLVPTVAAGILGENYFAIFVVVLAIYVIMGLVGGFAAPELGEKGELARRAREQEQARG